MKEPFVSIINPIRNVERTIDKNLEYLINLDYPGKSLSGMIPSGGISLREGKAQECAR